MFPGLKKHKVPTLVFNLLGLIWLFDCIIYSNLTDFSVFV